MEHRKRINTQMHLISALLMLEQLTLITYVYSAKILVNHTETGCTNCKLRSIKTIKKALSDCCPDFYEEVAQVEIEMEYNDDVEQLLQAFHRVVAVH